MIVKKGMEWTRESKKVQNYMVVKRRLSSVERRK
jgi:hypothetical protein